MKVLVYSARSYDQEFLKAANQGEHELYFTETHLDERTTVLARQYPSVCCFVDDILNKRVIKQLSDGGTRLVALRATGFNNVDLKAAEEPGMTILRSGRVRSWHDAYLKSQDSPGIQSSEGLELIESRRGRVFVFGNYIGDLNSSLVTICVFD